MVQLTGMAVTLTTADVEESGTNDHLYIGVFGEGGGREFPLDSANGEDNDDFKDGETEKFALGLIWEGGFIDGSTKFPINRSQERKTILRLFPSIRPG